MAQKGFYFDGSRCTGCKTCELACKDYKDLGAEILFRRVYDMEGGDWEQTADGAWTTTSFVYHVSAACNACDNPACLAVCSSGATKKDADSGLVTTDPEICLGCGTCSTACPYFVPKLDAEKGYTVRCDGCIDRVGEGKMPMCVEACPLRALEFDDITVLRQKYGDNADIHPLASSNNTQPNIVIKVPQVPENNMATAEIANELEVA